MVLSFNTCHGGGDDWCGEADMWWERERQVVHTTYSTTHVLNCQYTVSTL